LAVIPSLEDKSLPAKRKAGGELRAGSDAIARVLDQPAKAILSDTGTDFSAATESYRMLRTSVLLSTAERPPKTILVTSGQPGDGKTTTVYNTAIAFTQLKAHVLVIDCDMRKPRIHSMARIKREQGLSTFLSSGGELGELIKQTPIPYLSVLPCGHIPPNPSELISSDKMKEMLSFLSEHYDYIFIDSPPLITVTDPIILSTLVDGVILVVKSGKSKSEVARRACQDLAGVGAKILGVVLNDLNVRHEGYDYYNYSRYYSDYVDQAKSNGAGS
jgi:capsular exopolysaccharide synthesis family protein